MEVGRKEHLNNDQRVEVCIKRYSISRIRRSTRKVQLLEPKERIELLIDLIPYVLPKITSVSHTTNEPLDWN